MPQVTGKDIGAATMRPSRIEFYEQGGLFVIRQDGHAQALPGSGDVLPTHGRRLYLTAPFIIVWPPRNHGGAVGLCVSVSTKSRGAVR